MFDPMSIALMKKLGGGSGGGSGGASSWNDLTDKPFGVKTKNINLTWEGDVENPNYIPEMKMCKVSDTPLSVEDLVGSEITVECVIQTDSDSVRQTRTAYISLEDVTDHGSLIMVSMHVTGLEYGTVGIYSLPDVVNGLGPGVFFEKKEQGNVYCQPVRLVKENFTTIDSKYLPNATKAEKGALNFDDVLSIVKAENIELTIGELTYGKVNELPRNHVVAPLFYWNNDWWRGIWWTTFGTDGNGILSAYVISPDGQLCMLRGEFDGYDDDSVLTSVCVEYPTNLCIQSENGVLFNVTVSDDGTLTATEAT